MKQLLPPVPYGTPLTGPGGFISIPWTGFFKQLSQGLLNLQGSNTNDSASTGYVGEFLSGNSAGIAVAASGAYKALVSLTLTAGDWDVGGTGVVNLTGFTTTAISVGISLSGTALDSAGSGGVATLPASAIAMGVPTGLRRLSLAATTTVYLIGSVAYSGGSGSWSANSFIRARRVR